jgi:hypothetical protein
MGNDHFPELLRHFKQNETPEAVLLVADDPTLTKIVVAWNNLDVRPVKKRRRSPGESEHDRWDWLWANVSYSLDDLAERSGLAVSLVERKLKPLIGNRVLYPDGTVNSFVQRYLRERVLKLFDAKPRKPAKIG